VENAGELADGGVHAAVGVHAVEVGGDGIWAVVGAQEAKRPKVKVLHGGAV